MSDTEIKVIRSATKLFLTQGFSKTTHRQIADASGIGLGTITYHYKVKEDLLRVLFEELMDFHLDLIDASQEKSNDALFSYALEIAVQIALCETDDKAYDLYYAAYSHPATFDYIKDWAAKKNYHLLRDRLPDWSEEDFRTVENITSGIELAAFTAPKNRYFSLQDKISLFLDSMMKIYNIPESDRKQTISRVLSLDCEKLAVEMFDKFLKRLD
ncbi:MAG: TetR/AcrR family transcriptional regulator [Oscillospiraceae bacterium]|nr:TetR/AcrR family transcriptional regulator [Oscillospiraceae bacterium]MBR3849960.1 TetR/AcrR family transcriptional regulator [Oscillospiraceae bacterium]